MKKSIKIQATSKVEVIKKGSKEYFEIKKQIEKQKEEQNKIKEGR